MKKKLETLAKEYDFSNPEEYLDYIIESWINGQKTQCLELYKALRTEDKEFFLFEYQTHCKSMDMLKMFVKYEINR